MRKLKLDLHALQVDSFDVGVPAAVRGTVAAAGLEGAEPVYEVEPVEPDRTKPSINACVSHWGPCPSQDITCTCPTYDIGCLTAQTGCGSCFTGVPCCT